MHIHYVDYFTLRVNPAELPVLCVPLHQVLLPDPVGLKIEFTFDAAELQSAGPSNRPAAY